MEQANFRYRLLDASGTILWERFQADGEPSPLELYVSDSGWSVVRLHGYSYGTLLAIARDGREVINLAIIDSHPIPTPEAPPQTRPRVVAANSAATSAGFCRARSSVSLFLRFEEVEYFVLVASWGGRILINLQSGHLITEPSSPLAFACIEAENAVALKHVQDTSEGNRSIQRGCLGIVLRNRLFQAVPGIEQLWRANESHVTYQTGSRAFPNLRGYGPRSPRPVISLVLYSLGRGLSGHACYEWAGPIELAECIHERDKRLRELPSNLNAREALAQVGSPDYITSYTVLPEKLPYRWGERWDYYLDSPIGLTAYRIIWEAGSEGQRATSMGTVAFSEADISSRLTLLIGDSSYEE